MFMTNKRMVKEAREIVAIHAPLILKQLGLEENDGILDRIVVTEETDVSLPLGNCITTTQRVSDMLGLTSVSQTYVKGSAHIELNYLQLFYYLNKNGVQKEIPFFFRIFKSFYRKQVLTVLAHELRHYWQFYTGEYYKNELMMFGRSVLPYESRWCEKDANKYAAVYVKAAR